MRSQGRTRPGSRTARVRRVAVEALETRTLLAAVTEVFVAPPSVPRLIHHLSHTGRSAAHTIAAELIQAFQTQLSYGPVADLNAGKVSVSEFNTEVQSLETSFQQYTGGHFWSKFASLNILVNFQAEQIANSTIALQVGRSATLASVSGTATGSLATLTATLTATSTAQPIAGGTVTFTLDGKAVGQATTNASGVATLANVATTDTAGTHTGAVVANFAGNTNFASASATGDLTVNQATAFSLVSGSGTTGGVLTLRATLNTAAGTAVPDGQSVTFSVNGTQLGQPVTTVSGLATTTITTPAGLTSGTLTATYAGSPTSFLLASSGTGPLTIA